MRQSCLAGLLGCLTLSAQLPDLSGTWVSDSNASEILVLDQKPDKVHVQEMTARKVDAEFTCALNGQECSAKGHHEKIMMYFNGPKLVEIREHGNSNVKQRLALSADGKALTIETVPLSAEQKAETTSFHRQ
jgi:hypothetical protein